VFSGKQANICAYTKKYSEDLPSVTDDAICEVMQRVTNSTVALYIVVDLQIERRGRRWRRGLGMFGMEVTEGVRRVLFVSVHEKDTGIDQNYTNATTAIVSYAFITRHRKLQNYSLVIFVEDKVIIMMD
jgi:hypothetical protein